MITSQTSYLPTPFFLKRTIRFQRRRQLKAPPSFGESGRGRGAAVLRARPSGQGRPLAACLLTLEAEGRSSGRVC